MKLAILALPLCALVGCAGLTHKKDEAAVQGIHTAAVVGFAAFEPASASVGLSLNSGNLTAMQGGSMISEEDSTVDEMYAKLVGTLQSKLHWKVLGESKVAENDGYQKAYETTMKGWHNRMPPGKGEKKFLVGKVMDNDSIRIMDVAGRDALIRSLGVDAIVDARVSVQLHGNSVMGVGARHPASSVTFRVYTLGKEAPVWFEGSIRGEESEDSVGSTSFIDEGLLHKLALKSVETAYAKIGAEAQ